MTLSALSVQPDSNWQAVAACASLGPGAAGIFFSDQIEDIAAAKQICSTCPAIASCLDAALENNEQWGVWGGQLIVAGKIVMTKRRRGRPRKNPRPEDQMPVIPFPDHLRHLQPA